MKKPAEFESCAQRLRALADPDRLRILNCLFAGPRTVGDIAKDLEEDIVKVSHHLGILRRSKILLAQRRGRFIQYSVHPDVLLDKSDSTQQQINFGCCLIDLAP